MLATGSGQVFAGKLTGEFIAIEEAAGRTPWQLKTGSSINSTAITYIHNGRQYVTVALGFGGGFADRYAAGTVPTGGSVRTFALMPEQLQTRSDRPRNAARRRACRHEDGRKWKGSSRPTPDCCQERDHDCVPTRSAPVTRRPATTGSRRRRGRDGAEPVGRTSCGAESGWPADVSRRCHHSHPGQGCRPRGARTWRDALSRAPVDFRSAAPLGHPAHGTTRAIHRESRPDGRGSERDRPGWRELHRERRDEGSGSERPAAANVGRTGRPAHRPCRGALDAAALPA